MKFFSKVTLLNRKQLDTWKLVSIFKVVYFVFKVICWNFSHQIIHTYVHILLVFFLPCQEENYNVCIIGFSPNHTSIVKDETVET